LLTIGDMNLLRRMFGRLPGSVRDPVLGSLVQREGQWTGVTSWDHSPQRFALTVHRTGEVPSQLDRATFQALARDYPALRTGLQDALHQLWSTARSQAEPEATDFGGSLELWSRISLQGMGLHPDGHAELIYGLEDSSRFEGAFIVSVRGLEVKPLEYVE
jgi:hypothetical protein